MGKSKHKKWYDDEVDTYQTKEKLKNRRQQKKIKNDMKTKYDYRLEKYED